MTAATMTMIRLLLIFSHLTAIQMESLVSEDLAQTTDNYIIGDIINCYMRILSEGKNKRSHIHMIDTLVIPWLMEKGNTYNDDSETRSDHTWVRIARAGSIYRQCEMIFFVVNRGRNHWYLGVLSLKNKELQILDPMKGVVPPETYEAETNILRLGIQMCLCSTIGKRLEGRPLDIIPWSIRIIDNIPKQTDMISCWLFCLKYMQLWDGDNITTPFSQADVDLFRNKLVSDLIFSDLNVIEEVQRVRGDIISLSKRNV